MKNIDDMTNEELDKLLDGKVSPAKIQELRSSIIEAVRNKGRMFYKDAADILELNLSNQFERDRLLCGALEKINRFNSIDKPMLTAAVVRQETKMPGDGFFALALKWGKMKRGENKQLFYAKELGRVHNYDWT